MSNCRFYKPDTLAQALDLLDSYREKAVIINGGTDIVEKITKGMLDPEAMIYIKDIPELKGIKEEAGFIVIGGGATYTEVEQAPVCQKIPGIMQAVAEIGCPAIRHVATPAGNIGSAVPAADFNVILLALDAEIILASKSGERKLAIKDVFVGPGQTKIKENELIKEIKIPVPGDRTFSSFLKLARRKIMDIAQVTIAVSLTLDGTVCEDIRIALGAINPVPVRSYSLEKMMIGKDMKTGLAAIRGVFPPEVTPREDRFKTYKEQVTNTAIERAINKAYMLADGGAKNGQGN